MTYSGKPKFGNDDSHDVLLRRKPSTVHQTDAEKWGNWEGKIICKVDAESEVAEMCFVADLLVLGDQVGGAGLMASGDVEVSISGTLSDDTVSLEILIDFGVAAREPFVCSGHITCDGSEIHGTWVTSCWCPDDCGCDGLTGDFELVRID